MRAVHRARVTAADVGRRVSVRHRASGGEVTDAVGRLVAWFEDYPVLGGRVLVLVDRHGFGHEIPVDDIISSRVIPPHPRRPPEPEAGTRAVPLLRDAGRVVLIDDHERILLVRFVAAPTGPVWVLPGGGRGRHESFEEAARRGLREATGHDQPLGPWIWSREHDLELRVHWRQRERIFLASRTPASAAQTEIAAELPAREGLDDLRWLSLGELQAHTEAIDPPTLPHHLDRLLRDGPPMHPVAVS